jgi:hypothetical protein
MTIYVISVCTYFIIFIDDHFIYSYVSLMKYKFKSFKRFKDFRNKVQNKLKKSIKILWSNWGGEYLSLVF